MLKLATINKTSPVPLYPCFRDNQRKMSRKRVQRKPLPENRVQFLDEPKYDFSNIPPKLRRKSKPKSSCSEKPDNSSNSKSSCSEKPDNFVKTNRKSDKETTMDTAMSLERDNVNEAPFFLCDWSTADTPVGGQDPNVLYRLLLRRSKYFAPCSSDMMSFAIADYDRKNKDISKHHIHIVARQTKGFTDKFAWVYSCTCDQANATYLESLPAHINASSREFSFKTCIHIDATKKLVETIDEVQEISPSLYDDHCYERKSDTKICDIYEIDFPETMVGVLSRDGLPGVVGKSHAGLHCFTCQSKQCHHCRKVNKMMTSSDVSQIPDVSVKQPQSVSQGVAKLYLGYVTCLITQIASILKMAKRFVSHTENEILEKKV